DLGFDPDQYGTGIVAVDGRVTMHGAVKSPTFTRVGAEPQAFGNVVSLQTAVSGWQPGDRLLLPDTRQIDQFSFSPQWEERPLQTVSGDRLAITLANALSYDHWGARDGDGHLDFLPHLADLTRNVVIRSANPNGTRGHTLFTRSADVDIRYV